MFHGASPRSKLFDKLIIGFGVAYCATSYFSGSAKIVVVSNM